MNDGACVAEGPVVVGAWNWNGGEVVWAGAAGETAVLEEVLTSGDRPLMEGELLTVRFAISRFETGGLPELEGCWNVVF